MVSMACAERMAVAAFGEDGRLLAEGTQLVFQALQVSAVLEPLCLRVHCLLRAPFFQHGVLRLQRRQLRHGTVPRLHRSRNLLT